MKIQSKFRSGNLQLTCARVGVCVCVGVCVPELEN